MSTFGIGDLDFARMATQIRQGEDMKNGMTREQLGEVAKTFEQMLLGMMVEEMRGTIPDSELMPKAPGHDMYEQMLYQEFVRNAGERSLDLGMREALERHFEAFLTEESTTTPPPDDSGAGTSVDDAAGITNDTERRTAGS